MSRYPVVMASRSETRILKAREVEILQLNIQLVGQVGRTYLRANFHGALGPTLGLWIQSSRPSSAGTQRPLLG